MQIGVFADVHDHLDNLRRAVALFNARRCQTVVFAGDLVSTFAVPPLRRLECPLVGCFGDNEGNRAALAGGFRVIGTLREPPALFTLADGTRLAVAHIRRQIAKLVEPFDVAVYGHSHRPKIHRDEQGRLWINPGETCGWTYGLASVALLDTTTMAARIEPLVACEPLTPWHLVRGRKAAP